MAIDSKTVISMLPEFIFNVDKTILKSKQMKLEQCTALIKICEQHSYRLVEMDNQFSEIKKKNEYKMKTLNTEINNIKQEVFAKENEIDALRKKIKIARNSSHKADSNARDDNELKNLMEKVCTLQNSIESQKKAMKLELAQYQRGIYFYKHYFGCNVLHVPKNTLIFTLNSSAKVHKDTNEYIKFSTNDNGNTFQYVEMQPKLENEQSLVKRYHDTCDIQSFIVSYCRAVKLLTPPTTILGEKN